MKHLLRSRPIYAYRFEGTRYDAGDKLGFLKATVEFARAISPGRPEFRKTEGGIVGTVAGNVLCPRSLSIRALSRPPSDARANSTVAFRKPSLSPAS